MMDTKTDKMVDNAMVGERVKFNYGYGHTNTGTVAYIHRGKFSTWAVINCDDGDQETASSVIVNGHDEIGCHLL